MQPNFLYWSIAGTAPFTIAYTFAIVSGLRNLRRYPTPAKSATLGGVIGALTSVSWLVVREWIFENAQSPGGDVEGAIQYVLYFGTGVSVVHAVGLTLIVFAVFAGRTPPPRDRNDRGHRDDREPLQRASRPPG